MIWELDCSRWVPGQQEAPRRHAELGCQRTTRHPQSGRIRVEQAVRGRGHSTACTAMIMEIVLLLLGQVQGNRTNKGLFYTQSWPHFSTGVNVVPEEWVQGTRSLRARLVALLWRMVSISASSCSRTSQCHLLPAFSSEVSSESLHAFT